MARAVPDARQGLHLLTPLGKAHWPPLSMEEKEERHFGAVGSQDPPHRPDSSEQKWVSSASQHSPDFDAQQRKVVPVTSELGLGTDSEGLHRALILSVPWNLSC